MRIHCVIMSAVRLLNKTLCFCTKFICEEKCRVCNIRLDSDAERSGTSSVSLKHQSMINSRKTLCISCWSRLEKQGPSIVICQIKGNLTLLIASGVAYNSTVKKLIYRFKDNEDRLLAVDFAALMVRAAFLLQLPCFSSRADDIAKLSSKDQESEVILVPVPLHPLRKLKRGFNQSEVLAQNLRRLLGWKVDAKALIRTRLTPDQKQLTKAERLNNVCGAFRGNYLRLVGKTVVLVDDVSTSGATLIECAKEVLNCGGKKVLALTAASVPLWRDQA